MSCAPKLYVIQYSHVFTRFQILGSQFFFYHFCLIWAGEVPNSWPGSQEYPKQYGLPGNDPEYVERCRRLLPLGPVQVPVVPAPFAICGGSPRYEAYTDATTNPWMQEHALRTGMRTWSDAELWH